jgi:hypothetical protein
MASNPQGLGAKFDAHIDAEFKTRDHVATYHRVLLELSAGEAHSVRWRSGFYDVQDSSSEAVSRILGEPNIATELGKQEP